MPLPVAKLPPQSRLKELFSYDPETGVLRWKERHDVARAKSWNAQHSGRDAGCIDAYGYKVIRIDGRLFKSHRIVWKMHTGDDPLCEIDHVNGNAADNRILNLRKATHSENLANIPPIRNRELPTGVSRLPYGRGFCARIVQRGKVYNLGAFRSVSAAGNAYAEASRKLRGEFHRQG